VPTEAELQREWDTDLKVSGEVDRHAHQWFVDENAKKLILAMLADNKLDEYAIETEATRIVAPQLEMFERRLASLEARRNKALRLIADLHGSLGRQLYAAVEQVIDGEVLALDNAAKKSPSPTA
jgi:hypothetical protein